MLPGVVWVVVVVGTVWEVVVVVVVVVGGKCGFDTKLCGLPIM